MKYDNQIVLWMNNETKQVRYSNDPYCTIDRFLEKRLYKKKVISEEWCFVQRLKKLKERMALFGMFS